MEYYLGLDIGTNSVGWAVTDSKYNLLRAKGKDLWGVRLFQEAKTAADRRVHRSNRRRNSRKNLRLQLLRELFEEEIEKVDKEFFERLDDSKFWEEDKKTDGKNSLFNDKDYNDKDYFKEYPTIFHLRKALMEGKTSGDIRLYFLAINQMMKRRGHFLIEGKLENVSDINPFKVSVQRLINEELDVDLDGDFYDKVLEIVLDINSTKTDKKIAVKDLVNETDVLKRNGKKMISIWDLFISGKKSVKSIFDDEEIIAICDEEKCNEIILSGDKYEEQQEFLERTLDYRYEIISSLKAIFDYGILQEVLHGEENLSDAQVRRYEKHKDDLKKLKKLIKKYDIDNLIYNKIFKNKDGGLYVSYLGYYKKKNNNREVVNKISYEEFIKNLKKEFENLKINEADKDYQEIKADIEQENFLLKQIVSTNSVIPHQIHQIELKLILDRLVKDYPSFLDISDGVTKAKKIEMIFKFRIPYYVGPLNDYHKGEENAYAWIIKNKGHENEKIRPWNFKKIVNEHACEEEFIKRMINECTYLPNEKVIPKASLLYSEYMVLNELNNLNVNGSKLDPTIKSEIIDGLYKNQRKVTIKKIRDFLIKNNYADSDLVIEGLADDVKANMSTYIDFKEIFGENFDEKMAEDIIEQITIHVGNRKLLKEKISEKYPEITESQLNQLINKKYKDWSRFSKQLLIGLLGVDKETGEANTIIGFLRTKSENFMELMSSQYTFDEIIKEIKEDYIPDKLDYSIVDSLYVSPAVKKMIWQVLRINQELIDILGNEPKKIFIEMARGKEEGKEEKLKENSSRKKQLSNLYKAIGKDGEAFLKGIEDKSDADFRNRAVYLYYTQMGKCMYSGENIDFGDIFDKSKYDIDHIIPRSLKKDDSIINNLVLVKRNLNQTVKGDLYPVPQKIRKDPKVTSLWNLLYNKKLIEEEKYNRLIRKSPLSDRELADFINRQLVETRQTTKVIKDLFDTYYSNSKVITVKAGLVSELRRDFEVLKCREINDLHHAHDAFLNIIVGDVWNKKFTSNPYAFVKSNRGNYTLNHVFTKNQSARGEEIWNVAKGKEKIIKTLNKPSVLFSSETYEASGELYDATIKGKKDYKKNTTYLPLKKDERLNDVSKYGGYVSIKGAYFFLVEHIQKNKRIKTIEFVPIYLKDKIEKDKDELIRYCINTLKLENPKILIEKIKFKTEIFLDGFSYLISSRTGDRLVLEPNMQMFWDTKYTNLFKKIFNKYNKSETMKEDLFNDEDKDEIILLINKIIDRLYKVPYSNRKILLDLKSIDISEFSGLELVEILQNILILTKKGLSLADLSKIGGYKNSGKIRMSKNIGRLNQITFINSSITGIYINKIKVK